MKIHPLGQGLALALALVAGAARAEQAASAYAGQQQRAIKSLSDSDVAGLLAGQGAGFAKAAELNGYPGPAHVLELAVDLQLDGAQLTATRSLFDQHKREAARLGKALVDAERQLDGLFAQRKATPQAVDHATARVGALQAELRAEHLKTHLTQTELLNPEQVRRYSALRGYDTAATDAKPSGRGLHSTHSH